MLPVATADRNSASSYSTAVEGGTLVQVHYIITGRIDPKTYLAFIADRAAWLDLDGWATLRGDGTVEMIAAGPEALVGALEMAAMLGPLDALIDRVDAVATRDVMLGKFAVC